MFKHNKYTNWYFLIINRSYERPNIGYTEKHHIIPKSMGGSNHISNIAILSGREHYICHLLLVKMVINKAHREKMAYASWQQTRDKHNTGCVNSRMYEVARSNLSKSYTGRKRKEFSIEHKLNMSIAHTGIKIPASPERIELMRRITKERGDTSGEKNSFFGKSHTKEAKEKIGISSSIRFKGIPKVKIPCIYCGKLCAPNIIKRFHNDNCKLKPI